MPRSPKIRLRATTRAALLALTVLALMLLPRPSAHGQGATQGALTLTGAGSTLAAGGSLYLGNDSTAAIYLSNTHPSFFIGERSLNNGVYYMALPNGNPFGYYAYLGSYTMPTLAVSMRGYIYHFDMGYEYTVDAADGHGGLYLYDFASQTWFYTSPTFPFPYLYDFKLKTVVYYFPDAANPGRYNTDGLRYFYRFDNGWIITM